MGALMINTDHVRSAHSHGHVWHSDCHLQRRYVSNAGDATGALAISLDHFLSAALLAVLPGLGGLHWRGWLPPIAVYEQAPD